MVGKLRRTANINVREFKDFFQGWLVRQEHYLEELRSALRNESCDEDLRDLIARVLAHYQQYYEEKSRIANRDVALVFSPPWFSPFEQSFFWIAGFKPGLAFRILGRSVDDLSREQSERVEMLRMETKTEERELENELVAIQESVAAPPIVKVSRRENFPVNGDQCDTEDMESVMETLRGEMEVVLANADMLRSRTAERLVEILTPVQNLRFLAAVTELQLKIRIWGWQIDADRQR